MMRRRQFEQSDKMGGEHIQYDHRTAEVVGTLSSPLGLQELFRYPLSLSEYTRIAKRMNETFGKTRAATKALFNTMAAGAGIKARR